MFGVSLFSRGEVQILCDYANGDAEAIEPYRQMLLKRKFRLWVRKEGSDFDVPVRGAEASKIFSRQVNLERNDASLVLHWFSDPGRYVADKPRAVEILNEHLADCKLGFGAFPGGPPSPATTNKLEVEPKFPHPIDWICDTVAGWLTYDGSVAAVQERPIRVCGSCEKLFAPRGRARFCGAKCKVAFHNRKHPVDAFAQFKYRTRRLRKFGPRTLKRMKDKIERSKLPAAEKEMRVVFLESRLRVG